MTRDSETYQNYIHILQEELLPATGCTEPIAIAYGAAKAREALGSMPTNVLVEASGNIIKNVKSVVVPGTGGMKGIQAAAAAGIVAGQSSHMLEVIAGVTPAERAGIRQYMKNVPIEVRGLDTGNIFDIIITLQAGQHCVKLRIIHHHTNIVLLEKDGQILFETAHSPMASNNLSRRDLLNVKDIIRFANSVQLEDIQSLFQQQISCNTAIAQEGMQNHYGAAIGQVLLATYGDDIKNKAAAMAAAGSDARMSGCEMPVVILSGSGNQGLAASVPVIVYARHLGKSEDELIRALAVSSLITIHLKTGIGRLSAYCGAVSAGCASGAGIACLLGEGYDEIAHTLVNGLSIVSGIICDGAKSSCAAKISMSVNAGIMGYFMYKNGQQFYSGEGIVADDVESTIRNVGRLGREGMRQTDKEIIDIMISSGKADC